MALIFCLQTAVAQHSNIQSLTLAQVEELVSHHVPDSTMHTEIQRRGLAFAPNATIVDSLRAKGAGPLTLEAIEAFFSTSTRNGAPAKPNSSAPVIVLVIDPPSNVRASPSAASPILCSVTSKASIRILGAEGNWYKTDVAVGSWATSIATRSSSENAAALSSIAV